MPHEEIAWWNFNIPHNQQTPTCPDSLFNSGEKDKRLIGTWDADYERLNWNQVKTLIASNRIDIFQRVPSDLRRYRQYIHNLENAHGSIAKYIQRSLLQWPTLIPSGPPFTCPSDIKILHNDWPYGIDQRIIHLVIWTKFQLEEDATGDLADGSRKQIQEYVDKTFGSQMDSDRIAWFKNWRSLKSVQAVEHFHVMLFDPDMDFVKEITRGHVPMCEQLRQSRIEDARD